MASNTQISMRRRELRQIVAGRRRKAKIRNHGNTKPSLPLNKPNANEKAQHAKRAK